MARRQRGATLAEFIVAAPVVLMVGGGTLQTGLLYHGKTTLNYATFEAARAGAVHHAQVPAMRDELGVRLAPLQGGTGEMETAAAAIARSKASVADEFTKIRVLNPTREAFEKWGETSVEDGRRVIPNSHLQHRDQTEVKAGVSLRDANLLKIEVVHGVELRVPFIGGILAAAMRQVDPKNRAYYDDNRFPLTSVATVRMQSEAWADPDVFVAAGVPADGGTETLADAAALTDVDASFAPNDDLTADTLDGNGGGLCGAAPPLDLSLPTLGPQRCDVVGAGGPVPLSTPISVSADC